MMNSQWRAFEQVVEVESVVAVEEVGDRGTFRSDEMGTV